MGSSEALATIPKLFQAVTHQRCRPMLAAYHPDSVISEASSLPYRGDYSGPKGVMQQEVRFIAESKDVIRVAARKAEETSR
jgi:hypothetical protein